MPTKVASLYAEIGADTSGLQKGVTQSKSSLQQLKQSVTQGNQPLRDMKAILGEVAVAGGVVTGAVLVMKKAFDFAKEGAQLEYTKERFDRLAASIGTTGDALMIDLKTATHDTRSEMELMASASDMMALGLAKSQAEAVRLAKVAGGLNMNMNQLVLTLTNQTTMRFDALGVSVDGFKEKVESLKKSGMDANAAFKEAFLQQAEEQLKRVGDISETDAGKLMRLEATFANLGNTVKMKFAPPIVDAADALNTLLTWNEKVTSAFEAHNTEIRKTADSYDDYVSEMLRAAVAGNLTNKEHAEAIKIMRDRGDAVDELLQELGILTQAEVERLNLSDKMVAGDMELAQRLKQVGYAMDGAALSAEQMADAEKKAAAVQEILKGELSSLDQLIGGRLGSEFDSFKQKQGDLSDQTMELKNKIAELGGTEYMTADQSAQVEALQGKLNGVVGRINDLNDKLKSGDFGKNKAKAAKVEVDSLEQQAYKLELQIKKLGGSPYSTPEQRQQLEDARKQLMDVNQAIKDNAAAHEDATRRILFSLIEQRAAQDGLTQNEVESLTTIAEQWGLVDQKTAAATREINKNIGSLDTATPDELLKILEKIFGLPSSKEFHFKITTSETKIQQILNPTGDVKGQKPEPRAAGGGARAFHPYIVGEHGPEWFVPNTNGQIFPHGTTPGGNGYTYNDYSTTVNQNPAAAAMNANLIRMKKRERFNSLMGVG